jgi:hypothetical protein
VGAHVEEPAPTINIPVFCTTTVDLSSAGEYWVTIEWVSPVNTQKSPPHCAKATPPARRLRRFDTCRLAGGRARVDGEEAAVRVLHPWVPCLSIAIENAPPDVGQATCPTRTNFSVSGLFSYLSEARAGAARRERSREALRPLTGRNGAHYPGPLIRARLLGAAEQPHGE